MEYIIFGKNHNIAYADTTERIITDPQSALDFIMSAKYETGCERLILNKASVADEFFVLSSGMAGEILQKFINYGVKIALIGDYSGYTSKPLRDFIYESNNGKDVFFLPSVEEAVAKWDA